jgi:excisionase family DNA binding protein
VELLTVSEVARRSGVSRTSIYRLAHRGALRPWSASGPGGRPMLRAEVVAELRRGVLLRQRVDSPWAPRRDRAPAAPVVAVEADALELEALDDDDDAIEPPYGAWPADSWAGWAALGWADWAPEQQLQDAERWEHVAGLLGAWLPYGELSAIQAASLCLAADEAREAVAAGVRWHPARWAAAAAAVDAANKENPPGNQTEGPETNNRAAGETTTPSL